jgi:histidinol-phosphatase (PHP family)
MRFDCHLHSTHSVDAHSTIEAMCRSALRRGLSLVCFTEHYDLNPEDPQYRHYHHERYREELSRARAAFDGRLEILWGIEFSEPHRHPREFEVMAGKGFDFILGSVHAFGDTWAGAVDILEKYPAEKVFEMHYAETLKMARFGGFDALAHMDFPRRFLDKHSEPAELIDPILSTLVRSGIALELNASPLRKGLAFSLPSPSILRRYRELGGRWVTAGSDAHHADDVGSGFDHLADQIRLHRLEPVVFRGRKRCPVESGGG